MPGTGADVWPAKPIRIITVTPGGPADSIMRLIAPELAERLGQPVNIETHPSALTADMLARAAPDGYTLGMAAGSTWLTPLMTKTSYDGIHDFVPITLVMAYAHFLVVHPSLSVRTLS